MCKVTVIAFQGDSIAQQFFYKIADELHGHYQSLQLHTIVQPHINFDDLVGGDEINILVVLATTAASYLRDTISKAARKVSNVFVVVPQQSNGERYDLDNVYVVSFEDAPDLFTQIKQLSY